jgi:ATP-binding cassette subfamily F protein 3
MEIKFLKDISLLVERGSKIAFVGQNGQGKSTFIKAIVNEFEYEGDIKLGTMVVILRKTKQSI